MARSKTGAARISKAEAMKRAVQLRRTGMTQRQIGEAIGRSAGQVCRLLNEALTEYRQETEKEVAELRAWESQRLDTVLRAAMPQAINGHLGAIDRVIRITQERAKLYGLYAPTKIAPTDPDGRKQFGGLAALLAQHRQDDEGDDS